MTQGPIVPEELAFRAVFGQLRNWMVDEAERMAHGHVDGTLKSLAPPIAIQQNPVMGIGELNEAPADLGDLHEKDRRYLRIWFSEDEDYSQESVARMLSALKWLKHTIMLTCIGNGTGIAYGMVVHMNDLPTIRSLLTARYPKARIEVEEPDQDIHELIRNADEKTLHYRNVCPPMPYWGVFDVDQIDFNSTYTALSDLRANEIGFCQWVFRPLPPKWSSVLGLMMQTELEVSQSSQSYKSWIFSRDTQKKAQEKVSGSLFAVGLRIGCFVKSGKRAESTISSLLLNIASVRFSGSPIELITDKTLTRAGVLSPQIKDSLLSGATWQHGLIMSSDELSSLMLFPTKANLADRSIPLDRAPQFTANLVNKQGVFIAHETVCGKPVPVIWPQVKRSQHMLISGIISQGKTFIMVGMAADIANKPVNARHPKEGLAIIDPHDTAIQRFLYCIDDSRIEDCILHDPMDTEYVLCLPLFDCSDIDQVDMATSNITHQISSFFKKADMGHNISQGIHKVVRTILLCADLSLIDVRILLAPSHRGAEMRERVCSEIADEMLIDYWSSEFDSLDRASIARIRSRVEYLLEPVRLRPLLANKISKVTYLDIMDESKIFLAQTNPAKAGVDMANILGTLHTTGLQSAAHQRKGETGKRPIFTVFADEFGNYGNPRNVEHALRTIRKCDVSEVLATQNIESLPEDVQIAIGNIGAHVVLRQGWDDAQHYFKEFCGMVPASEFMMKDVGHGFIKIGDRIASIKAPLPETKRDHDILEAIRENTRQKYCVPIKEFKERMIDEHHVSLEDMKELDQL